MDAKEVRKAVEQGKPVDIGALCDCIENLTQALARANKTIADLTKMIEELSNSISPIPSQLSSELKSLQLRKTARSQSNRKSRLPTASQRSPQTQRR